ncbi:MAG: class I SAM-dependent methyltransferase, partial [Alicyclobacillus sp.]|nr:class I SAM-dependent methyltransferase [Alicyclobacillus sp.]
MKDEDVNLLPRIQAQFGPRAQLYVDSPTHAQGEDLSLLCPWLQPRPSWHVLDIACGGGHVCKHLAPHVAHIVACDATLAMLTAARHFLTSNGLVNLTYVHAIASQLPFPEASFDAVTCRLAAHH